MAARIEFPVESERTFRRMWAAACKIVEMQAEFGLSKSGVHQIAKRFGLQPRHRPHSEGHEVNLYRCEECQQLNTTGYRCNRCGPLPERRSA